MVAVADDSERASDEHSRLLGWTIATGMMAGVIEQQRTLEELVLIAMADRRGCEGDRVLATLHAAGLLAQGSGDPKVAVMSANLAEVCDLLGTPDLIRQELTRIDQSSGAVPVMVIYGDRIAAATVDRDRVLRTVPTIDIAPDHLAVSSGTEADWHRARRRARAKRCGR